MSYSCGKDSTLALHKMLAAGHEPAALVVMFNESAGRSYFHGADRPMLEAYGRALGLPVRPVPTAGETYHLAMETALVRITRETWAEAVCFGDIDIQANRDWCEARARAAGLNRQKATKADNTADSPLLYSVRMLTWAEVSWSMLPSS